MPSAESLHLMDLLFSYFSEWEGRPAPLCTCVPPRGEEIGVKRLVLMPCGECEYRENGGNRLGFSLSLDFRPERDRDHIYYTDRLYEVFDYIRGNPISAYAHAMGKDLRFAGIDCRGNAGCESLASGYVRVTLRFALVWASHSGADKPFLRFVCRGCSVIEGIDFALVSHTGLEASESFIKTEYPVRGGRRIVASCFADARRIVLRLCIEEGLRESFITRFAPSAKGVLYVSRQGRLRYIPYAVEKAEYGSENCSGIFYLDLTLFCADPCFRSDRDSVYTIHSRVPLLTFPFNSVSGAGITASVLRSDMNISVVNGGHAEAGVRVRLEASSSVANPVIRFGDRAVELEYVMAAGDVIEISTLPGEQGVTLNGEKSLCFSRSSEFFTLPVGRNLIEIDADSGISSLDAAVTVVERYYGI